MAPFKSSKSRNIGQQLRMWTTSNFGDVLKNPAAVVPEPISATGGTEYSGPNGLKYHVFTSSTPSPTSTLVVTGGPGTVTMLAVAGGGGGGRQHGGAGGAGALYFRDDLPVSAATYPVAIGAGGGVGPTNGSAGGNTTFGTSPQPQYLVLNGGGYGGNMTNTGGPGGSGGGGGMNPVNPGPHPNKVAGGSATGSPTHPGSPYVYANAGGSGSDYSDPGAGSGGIGGGGGGAGTVGSTTDESVSPKGDWPDSQGGVTPTNNYGQGGDDFPAPTPFLPGTVMDGIAAAMGSPTEFLGFPTSADDAVLRLFGGGGGGGSHSPWGIFDGINYPNGGGGSGTPATPGKGSGGRGGKGNTGPAAIGLAGIPHRGAGGGGSGGAPTAAGAGGSGVVIIAYPS